MAVGSKLQVTIKEWGVLVMFIVIISVILLKFRTSDSVSCPANYVLNQTQEVCCQAGNCLINTSVTNLHGDIATYVSAFSEPKNWVTIVIIAIIGISLLAMFYKMKSK